MSRSAYEEAASAGKRTEVTQKLRDMHNKSIAALHLHFRREVELKAKKQAEQLNQVGKQMEIGHKPDKEQPTHTSHQLCWHKDWRHDL